MTGARPLRVGIAAMHNSLVGYGGGLDVYTHDLVEALADFDQGNEYVVLHYAAAAEAWAHRSWPANLEFVALDQIEPRRPLKTRVARRLRRLARRPEPPQTHEQVMARRIDGLQLDLLHYPATLVWPLSIQTPYVLGFWDMQHEFYPEFFTQAELEERAGTYKPSVAGATRVIAPSGYTRRSLIERYGVSPGRVEVIPHGLSKRFLRAGVEDVERVRLKYGLPSRYLFYPANPWPHKNHARLMAALRLYGERYGEAPALALSGRLRNEPRDARLLALAAGVEQQVIDLGFVPSEDLPALYTGAAMLVFPSLFEGFGIPLLEAMACGCPIAAANATAIPECVGEAAVLFDPVNPAAIAEAIHTLLVDEDLACDLRGRGKEQLARFSWREIAPQVVGVYRRAVEHPP
jgi:glycosyltransferase involved in cell wall biosynthesis